MPSQDFAAEKQRLMDQPGLTVNQQRDIEAEMDRREKEYEDRHRASATEQRQRIEAQMKEHEAELKRQLLEDLMPRFGELRAERITSKQGLELEEALTKFIGFIEGREDGKWRGIANTYDEGLKKQEEILADPGAWADGLAKKYPAAYPDRFVTSDDVHSQMRRMHGRSS